MVLQQSRHDPRILTDQTGFIYLPLSLRCILTRGAGLHCPAFLIGGDNTIFYCDEICSLRLNHRAYRAIERSVTSSNGLIVTVTCPLRITTVSCGEHLSLALLRHAVNFSVPAFANSAIFTVTV